MLELFLLCMFLQFHFYLFAYIFSLVISCSSSSSFFFGLYAFYWILFFQLSFGVVCLTVVNNHLSFTSIYLNDSIFPARRLKMSELFPWLGSYFTFIIWQEHAWNFKILRNWWVQTSKLLQLVQRFMSRIIATVYSMFIVNAQSNHITITVRVDIEAEWRAIQ